MRRLFDFKCSAGHVNERLVDMSCSELPCSDCDLISKKIISPVRSALDPISGDFVGATAKWEKMRRQKMQQERKANS